MLELLQTAGSFLWGLLVLLWDLSVLVTDFVVETAYYLHTAAPRLEGLLVGVLLSWLLLRRDKHPLLRVLSAPLKLVVDILDLAWDQVVEVVGDLWAVAVSWVRGVWDWCKQKVVGGWSWMLSQLGALKGRLKK
tara:strand:+ start:633 stop:1034 length:402 start_codon:yes stop_codon:yes gene_type:complete